MKRKGIKGVMGGYYVADCGHVTIIFFPFCAKIKFMGNESVEIEKKDMCEVLVPTEYKENVLSMIKGETSGSMSDVECLSYFGKDGQEFTLKETKKGLMIDIRFGE